MERIKTVEQLNQKIEEYRKKAYNIPGNSVYNTIGDNVVPVLNEVLLDTTLPGSQDIRPSRKTGRFIITARGLSKFQIAAYITFDPPAETSKVPSETMITLTGWRFDMAGGMVKTGDGKSINIKAYEDAQRIKMQKDIANDKQKAAWPKEKKDNYIDGRLAEDVVRLRQYYKTMAVTGAQSRIIQKLLGLKADYSMEELKKPFLIVSAIYMMSSDQALRIMTHGKDLYPDLPTVTFSADEDAQEEASHLLEQFDALPAEEAPEHEAAQEEGIPFAELSRNSKVALLKDLLTKKKVVVDYELDQMTSHELTALHKRYSGQE
jgi:hypothetical protein